MSVGAPPIMILTLERGQIEENLLGIVDVEPLRIHFYPYIAGMAGKNLRAEDIGKVFDDAYKNYAAKVSPTAAFMLQTTFGLRFIEAVVTKLYSGTVLRFVRPHLPPAVAS